MADDKETRMRNEDPAQQTDIQGPRIVPVPPDGDDIKVPGTVSLEG